MGRGNSRSWIQITERCAVFRRRPWTRSASEHPSFGESRQRRKGDTWRAWDPRRSKISAGIVASKVGVGDWLPLPGESILYLGAGHGQTLSHIHDLTFLEDKSRIIACEISSRCLRSLRSAAETRVGIYPVLIDARRIDLIGQTIDTPVDVVIQDVSQADQARMFARACNLLTPSGRGLLSLKLASERGGMPMAEKSLNEAKSMIQGYGLTIDEVINIERWQRGHRLIIVRR